MWAKERERERKGRKGSGGRGGVMVQREGQKVNLVRRLLGRKVFDR